MNALVILSWVLLANPSHIQFSTESLTVDSNSGYLQLEWTGSPEIDNFILQRSTHLDFHEFTTVYAGPDQATFISGLDNGIYYFRVGSQSGHWSDVLTLSVKHQSLSLAYTLFGLGLLVFACTVFIVVKGVRTSTTHS